MNSTTMVEYGKLPPVQPCGTSIRIMQLLRTDASVCILEYRYLFTTGFFKTKI